MPVGFLQYGDSHPDIIEQFSCLSDSADSDGIGSMVLTGSSYSFTTDGIQVNDHPTTGATDLVWESAFCTANSLVSGFTVQFECEKAAFAATFSSPSGVVQQTFVRMSGAPTTTQIFNSVTAGGPARWRAYHSGNIGEAKTIDTGYRSHVIATVSFDPAKGTNGTLDLYADFFLVGSYALPADVTSITELGLMGAGTGAIPGFVERIKNVMIMGTPTSLTGVNEKEICVVADSWVANYGQYQSGSDSDNVPPITGYTTDDYGDGTIVSSTSYKNRCFFAALHYELVLLGIYPKDGTIKMHSRGGANLSNAGTNKFEYRTTSALQSTGASFVDPTSPAPVPGLGVAAADIWIAHLGTNNIGGGATVADLIIDSKTEIDRMRADGAELIIFDNVARRFDDPNTGVEEDAAAVQALNAGIAELQGYMDVTRVCDMYTGWVTAYGTSDGIHPTAEGQVYWAQQVAKQIKAGLGLGGSVGIGTIIGRIIS